MITVIIPSRSDEKIVQCVGAIREHDPYLDIVVVDDGLSKATHATLDARIVPGVKPFCFSRNVNIGIRVAGTDDVFVLNDDALLKTRMGVTALTSAANGWGIVAASCNNVGNRNQMPQSIPGVRPEPRMVCFVGVCIPRYTIDLIGFLDEDYVGYGFDDDDYCIRARGAGFRIGIYDGCYLEHGQLKSSYRTADQKEHMQRLVHNLRVYEGKWGAHPGLTPTDRARWIEAAR